MYPSREFTKAEKKTMMKLKKKISYAYNSILACLPAGRERSIVLSHLEDAALHVGVAIAENGIIEKED